MVGIKCSKCNNLMVEQPMNYNFTDGQESEYYAGNQHEWFCENCFNTEYIDDCPCRHFIEEEQI